MLSPLSSGARSWPAQILKIDLAQIFYAGKCVGISTTRSGHREGERGKNSGNTALLVASPKLLGLLKLIRTTQHSRSYDVVYDRLTAAHGRRRNPPPTPPGGSQYLIASRWGGLHDGLIACKLVICRCVCVYDDGFNT